MPLAGCFHGRKRDFKDEESCHVLTVIFCQAMSGIYHIVAIKKNSYSSLLKTADVGVVGYIKPRNGTGCVKSPEGQAPEGQAPEGQACVNALFEGAIVLAFIIQ